jgi:hypothetical protein
MGPLSRRWGPHDTRDQIVACSPGTVYNVVRQADSLRPRGNESRKGKGFVQPLTAHEHWHIDVAYINIAGAFVFMAKVDESELTADGRKNLQRLEKPRDNRLTLTYPPVSLRRTGLCWKATERMRDAVDRFSKHHCAGLRPAQWLP